MGNGSGEARAVCGDETIAVLVVDGDPRAGERLVRAISSEGALAAEHVETGDGALDRLSEEPESIDCVVSAQQLPDGTGLELLEAVRDRDRHLPFVLSPVEGSDRLASDAMVKRVTDYLPRSLDEEGKLLVHRVAAAVEAADRRRTRHEESEMLRTLLADVPIPIYFKDAEGRHVKASREVGTATSAAVIGRTDVEVYGDEFADGAVESYEDDLRVVETGEPIVDKEERQLLDTATDRAEIWLRTTKIPWYAADGTVKGLIGLTQEITEQKRREQQIERQKERLDRFASFVSHDLRSPLNLAYGHLQLAMETCEDPRLARVADALDRMDDLIEDLLQTARSEVGAPSIEVVPLALTAMQAWQSVKADGATLSVTVADDTVISADEGQLRQLFENLFRNAIEHAGPDVEIVVGPTDRGFFVEDDGPGIPPEERDDVLEYGYTGSEDGTGMGLAIVRQVVEAHDWSLVVGGSEDGDSDDGSGEDDTNDGGARFEVTNAQIVTPPEEPLEAGSTAKLRESTDVGSVSAPGDVAFGEDGAVCTITGGGRNVWGATEEFYFVHAAIEGDHRIVARLGDFEHPTDLSKAGVMVRAAEGEGAPFGFVGLMPETGTELLWRSEADEVIESTQLDDEVACPHWFRVDRIGDRVTCFGSVDGIDWIPIDQRTLPWDDRSVVGLAVCSHDEERSATATFDEVSVQRLRPASHHETPRSSVS